MDKNKIAVIGAGSGGLAFATYFANKGASVSVYDNDILKIKALKEKKEIKVSGVLDVSINSLTFTNSIEEAINDAKLIMVSIITNNIANVAKDMAPFLKPYQTIVLNPGHTFGAIEFVHIIKQQGLKELPIVAEAQDLIFVCGLNNQYDLKISSIKKAMDIATYNPNDVHEVIKILSNYFTQFNPVENVWVTSFNNISSILHAIPMLMNVSRIENGEDFKYYYEGITKAVAEIMDIVDQERLSIGHKLNVELDSILSWMKKAYNTEGNTIYECIQNNKAYIQIVGPKTLNHRFIFEDILSGLVPLSSMGHKLNVNTKMIDIFIDLGCIISQRNYSEEGRTLEKIGLDQMNVDNIKGLFK